MKHFIIILLSFLSLESCSQNKNQEINYLNKFYENYVNNWENETELNLLKEKNFSKELINAISKSNISGQLDYDPIVNAQDISVGVLKTLKINYIADNDFYEVSYSEAYKKNKVYIYLKVKNLKKSFIITDVKVNDIQSIIELNVPKKVVKTKSDNLRNDFKIINKGKDIIVNYNGKQDFYKNFIINEMSISTTLNTETDNNISLIYEFNASITKVKEQYKLRFSNNELYLVYKETIKFDSKGTAINRIYFNNYSIKNHTYDDIQALGNKLSFKFNDKAPIAYLYDSKNINFGKISYKSSNEDFFIAYPDTINENLNIENIEESNNVAYFLEQLGAYKESIILLKEILIKQPDRLVAYLNLADAYWGLNNKGEAKKSYQKYIALMKSQGKDLKKIPQRVYDRIK